MGDVLTFRRKCPEIEDDGPFAFWFEALMPLSAERRRELIVLAYRSGVADYMIAETLLLAWPDEGLDGRDIALLAPTHGEAG